jgi:hypothetical protein
LRTRSKFGEFEDVEDQLVGVGNDIPDKASENVSLFLGRKGVKDLPKVLQVEPQSKRALGEDAKSPFLCHAPYPLGSLRG